ncbi:hypothetical protein AZA_82769 [Nitrospirillum viridazoti Y2]|nr:hypothetical protein AZA_82769 [Nitrospirillum amazonense Y2]
MRHAQPGAIQPPVFGIPGGDEARGDGGQRQAVRSGQVQQGGVQRLRHGAGQEGPVHRRVEGQAPGGEILAVEALEAQCRHGADVSQAARVARRRDHEQPHQIVAQRDRQRQAGKMACRQGGGQHVRVKGAGQRQLHQGNGGPPRRAPQG